MRTLDYWKDRLLAIPLTIECPQMRLESGRDHERPVFEGPGYVDVKSSTEIQFTMFAAAADGGDAFRRLARAKANPYELFDQFRLAATDYQGIEWACGWTRPEFKGWPRVGWPLTGQLTSLATGASGPLVAKTSSVELIIQQKLWLPMEKSMMSVTTVGSEEIRRTREPGLQSIEALGSTIVFSYSPSDEYLAVTAETSDQLTHPYAENWIGEPLRILLGQLIYPRLVARNFGDGSAQVWLRPSPQHLSGSAIAALFQWSPASIGTDFWQLYADLLTMIGRARDISGLPTFESHAVTRFYEEIVQATQGSKWVLCLTLASVSEGLAKALMTPEEQRSDFDREDVDSLSSVVEKWDGDPRLRQRVLGDIAQAAKRTVGRFLRDLAMRAVLEKRHEQAWAAIRHAVMHGNLVTPWATKENDDRVVALAELVHRLTRELVRRSSTA